MIKRIIFLFESSFSQRNYQRFGIDVLQQNGFKVEVWDLTPCLHPEVHQNYNPPDKCDFKEHVLFYSKKNFCNRISILEQSDFVINIVAYRLKNFWIYKALSRAVPDYAVFVANAVLKIDANRNNVLFYLKKIKKLSFHMLKKIGEKYFLKLPHRWFGVKPASFVFSGGARCLSHQFPVDENSNVLWAHTLDYDLYLKVRDVPVEEENIAVFIDEDVPFHVDYMTAGIEPFVSAEIYYPLMNKFFELVEEQLGLEVVIAVHPRSVCKDHSGYFNGRKCIQGQTVNLVRQSKLVLMHSSTAINFVCLFHKPVCFLTFAKLNESMQGDYINAMANWFVKKQIFIDESCEIDEVCELKINKSRYESYRRAYIKTDKSPELPFWQIVATKLKEL